MNTKITRIESKELSRCLKALAGKKLKWHSHGKDRTISFINRIFTKEIVKISISRYTISFDIINSIYKKLTGVDHQVYKEIVGNTFFG